MRKLNYILILCLFSFMACGSIEEADTEEYWSDNTELTVVNEIVSEVTTGHEDAPDGFGVYDKKLYTDWGYVEYHVLANHHHTGAIIIDLIHINGNTYVIREGNKLQYNEYLTNASANLQMYEDADMDGNTYSIAPIFGIDRSPEYRQVFHMAEIAIIKENQ